LTRETATESVAVIAVELALREEGRFGPSLETQFR
jgi:hypothetical protein